MKTFFLVVLFFTPNGMAFVDGYYPVDVGTKENCEKAREITKVYLERYTKSVVLCKEHYDRDRLIYEYKFWLEKYPNKKPDLFRS